MIELQIRTLILLIPMERKHNNSYREFSTGVIQEHCNIYILLSLVICKSPKLNCGYFLALSYISWYCFVFIIIVLHFAAENGPLRSILLMMLVSFITNYTIKHIFILHQTLTNSRFHLLFYWRAYKSWTQIDESKAIREILFLRLLTDWLRDWHMIQGFTSSQ